jgi:hypothetical protein
MADAGIEPLGIGEEFTDGVIGKVAGAGKDALLDDPGIGPDLEHVEVVIGFEDEAIGLAEMDSHVVWKVAKIRADGNFCAVGAEGESDGVGGVVRNRERVNVDVADSETLAGLNGLNATEPLAEGVGKDALERFHGGLGDVERRFPEAEDLREAVAMIGVLVGDEDCVEAIDVALDSGEAGEGFAFSKAGVNEDASGFRLEQG